MFGAIRLTSSFVSNFAADRQKNFRTSSNARSWDKAPYPGNGLYFTSSKVRVILEPNYCLAKLVRT